MARGATGSSSAINFLGAVTDVQTSGASAHALYASNGGAISLGGGKIESTGDGAFGLYTSGVESTITVNGAPTIQTYGVGAQAARRRRRRQGGAVGLMNGGNITTNAGGSIGLVVQGSSSTIAGSGLTVQSYGNSVSRRTPAPPLIMAPASATRRV